MIFSWLKKSWVVGLYLLAVTFTSWNAQAQSVPFPDSPPYNVMSPWGYEDTGQGWDTSPYLSFIYQGTWFRLLPPNGVTYDAATNTWTNTTGQKFPLMFYSMGAGGRGTDNTIQLKGKNDIGEKFKNDVQSGIFPAYVLFWQTENQELSAAKFASLVQMALRNLDVDENRIYISGRSRGATQTWQHLRDRPDLIAASLSISGASGSFFNSQSIHVPVRHVQGGRDTNPTPQQSQDLVDQYVALGGDLEYFYYEDLGHSAWGRMYSRSDFYTWFLQQKKNQPLVFYGFTEVCPGEDVNIKLGYTAGFSGYEWRKDGNVIPGATGNEYTVTEFGTYAGRFRRGSNWTDWSDDIVISVKNPTITPPIATNGFVSKVLPSLDGKTTIGLELPEGYADYQWKLNGTSNIIGTERILQNAGPGEYIAQVQEFGGCTSSFGDPFTIVDANGANGPDAPANLVVNTLGKTEIELRWDQIPAPAYNETGFEIYRATSAEGPLELVFITSADATSYVDEDLNPNSTYWYQMRAVNDNGGSGATERVSGSTEVDITPPQAPTNVQAAFTSATAADLTWDPAVDNVGVVLYEIYINGLKYYVTTNTSYILTGLVSGQTYQVTVKAKDLAGNISPDSQVIYLVGGATASANFKFNNNYDEANGLNVNASGNNGITFSNTNLQEGSHVLALDGTNDYVTLSGGGNLFVNEFGARSVAFWMYPNAVTGNQVVYDEGGSTNGFALRINNGQLEFAVRDASNQITIGAPVNALEWTHVTAVFDNGDVHLYFNGTEVASSLSVGYTTVSRHTDASGFGATGGGSNAFNNSGNSFGGFLDDLYVFSISIDEAGIEQILTEHAIPEAPSDVTANAVSYNQIDVSWTDNSSIETGFQVLRSTSQDGPYSAVALLGPNAVNFSDSGLTPSTSYYYSVVALGTHGSAEFQSLSAAQAQLKFDGNLSDASGNGTVSALQNGASFNAVNKHSGSHSLDVSGTNDFVNFDTGNSFIHDAFTERSYGLWLYTDNVSGIQDIFDEGGSTTGMGLRINNGSIEAVVQNSQNIQMIAAPINASQWTHVAFVYNSGTMFLYVNGVQANSKLDLPFTTVGSHGNDGGIGASNSSNAFDQVNNNFNGLIDDFDYYLTALDSAQIVKVMNGVAFSATTFALPVVPTPPANLAVDSVMATRVQISWTDFGSTETAYEVYKSSTGPENLVLAETLGPNDSTYTFTDLFAHTAYVFAVRTVNVSGSSDPSVIEATTLNTPPSIPVVENILMRYDEVFSLPITATDPDGSNEDLALNGLNFPPFAHVYDYGDGVGELYIEPTPADEGVYTGLVIQVSDNFGGVLERTFNLTIGTNHTPVISGAASVNIKESETAELILSGFDEDGDSLIWSIANPPSMLSTVVNGNDLVMTFSPGLLDAGNYAINVNLADGNNGQANVTINVSVQDFDPNYEVFVNFGGAGINAPSPWNNIASNGEQGTTGASLTNNFGATTDISVSLETAFNGSSNTGGKSPGIYPDAVMLSYIWTSSVPEQIRISGLTQGYVYNFEMFGSRNSNGNRTTVFTAGGQSASYDATQNTSNTARLEGLVPDTNGEIVMTVTLGSGASYGYLNSMIIESRFEDGSAPAVVADLQASVNSANKVDLSWTDVAFNETGYRVLRSSGGAYVQVAELAADSESFTDNSATGHTLYSYYIESFNGNGTSSSETVAIATANNSPVITSGEAFDVLAGELNELTLQAADLDGDSLVLEVSGLPVWASFTASSTVNGEGTILANPGSTDIGQYLVTVTVSDLNQSDSVISSVQQVILLDVTDRVETKVFINFNSVNNAPSPWNNMSSNPTTGTQISNLLDNSGTPTNLSLRLNNTWQGANTNGVVTGDDSGIYPDAVMQTAYWEGTNQTKSLVLNGLQPGYIYDISFFGSRAGTGNRTTVYRINGEERSLNASNNSTQTVSFVGLDGSSGQLTIEVVRGAGSSYAYLNAMVITSYADDGLPNAPSDLITQVVDKQTINLGWNDQSSDETGFELWRAVGKNGGFGLIATLAPNTTSYTDAGLSSNTLYRYKVRSYIDGVGESDFSDISEASTYEYSVAVNFFDRNGAPAPWNNVTRFLGTGEQVEDLLDEEGNSRNLSLTIIQEFSGTNSTGMSTGDNSGIVPDAVLDGSYWLDVGQGIIEISGLSLVHDYNLKFIGSRNGGGNRIGIYTVNGQSVTLNASYNISEMVSINNIKADDFGRIRFSVEPDANASFAYLNGFILQASNTTGQSARYASGIGGDNSFEKMVGEQIKVYPNPARTEVNIRSGRAIRNVYMIDNVGRAVELHSVKNSNNEFNVALPGTLEPGMYLMRLILEDGQQHTEKIIKMN